MCDIGKGMANTHYPTKKNIQKIVFYVKAVAEAELAVNLVVLVPLTENMTTHSSPAKKIYKKM
jgi:hypothetical protein